MSESLKYGRWLMVRQVALGGAIRRRKSNCWKKMKNIYRSKKKKFKTNPNHIDIE
jgi:hypothetical protein